MYLVALIMVVALLILMAAPTPIARVTPTGYKMPDGYQTFTAITNAAGLQIWEKTVKPPGVDGGDLIDTTTMHNSVWRTNDTKKLKTLTEVSLTGPYNPDAYVTLIAQINVNQACTTVFPNNSKLTYYGAVTKVEVGDHKEGEMPEMTVSIKPTNWDPTNWVEAAPVYTDSSGT